MKVEKGFAPITFTIENEDELNVLMTLLHFAEFVDERFEDIHQQFLGKIDDAELSYYFGLKLHNLRVINMVKQERSV